MLELAIVRWQNSVSIQCSSCDCERFASLCYVTVMLFISMICLDSACNSLRQYFRQPQGLIQGAIGTIVPPSLETYERNFIHHDFVQFGKQHSWYKAILSSTALPQQCCDVYIIPLVTAKSLWDLTTKYYWNRPSPNLTGGIRPCRQQPHLRR